MDASEELVHQYLKSLGYVDVRYEPDGNVPPDFLIDGRIAVEVRRLNQNVTCEDGRAEGLEEVFIPFWQRMYNYLPTVAKSINGESWYVSIDISRPLEPWQFLEPRLRLALMRFMSSPRRSGTQISVTSHLQIDFERAGVAYDSFFVLGAGSDNESGGFVLGEVHKNLRLCSSEKEHKVAPYRDRYREWWLVLPDYIGHALDEEDRQQFRMLPPIAHAWTKLVLVNPFDPAHAFEI